MIKVVQYFHFVMKLSFKNRSSKRLKKFMFCVVGIVSGKGKRDRRLVSCVRLFVACTTVACCLSAVRLQISPFAKVTGSKGTKVGRYLHSKQQWHRYCTIQRTPPSRVYQKRGLFTKISNKLGSHLTISNTPAAISGCNWIVYSET